MQAGEHLVLTAGAVAVQGPWLHRGAPSLHSLDGEGLPLGCHVQHRIGGVKAGPVPQGAPSAPPQSSSPALGRFSKLGIGRVDLFAVFLERNFEKHLP